MMLEFGLSISHYRSAGPGLLPQSGLAAWFDPSDQATLWQDIAQTIPVTADGQAVAAMLDKSGGGFHLSQSNASAQPLYRTNGTLHWLEFDGVDDTLECPSGPKAAAATLGIAFDLESFTTGYSDLMETGQSMPRVYFSQAASSEIRGFWGSNYLSVNNGSALEAAGPISLLSWLDNGDATMTVGTATTTVTGVTPDLGDKKLAFGRKTFKGKVFAATYHYAALNTQERGQLSTYLDARAGI